MLEVRLQIKVLIPLIYLFTSTTSDKSPYTFYPSPSTPDREIDSKFILIDEKYNRTYFSAINTLYSSTLDLQNVKEYDLSPNDKVMADCLGKEKCRNFIKILKFDTRGNIFVCGTYAMSPKCLTFNRSEEGLNMIKMSTGNNRSPDVPDQNATIVYSDPFYFVATKGKNFKAIRKFYLNKDSVEAETVNKQTVFSNPHFVSSYTFGTNYTYFFFYEYSIENTERRLMYSRIGRVCKHDSGDGDNQYFYTFLKAQLKCYKKGESVDNYYDELRATEFVNVHDASSKDIEQYVYALFSTPDGLGGSALCRYRVRDIENLFDTSDLYEQKDDNWIKVPMSTERTKLSRPKIFWLRVFVRCW